MICKSGFWRLQRDEKVECKCDNFGSDELSLCRKTNRRHYDVFLNVRFKYRKVQF
jgi:hypothetical protein